MIEMLDGTSASIITESSSNQMMAKNSLANKYQTAWTPIHNDPFPYLKYTVVSKTGKPVRYHNVSVSISGIYTLRVYVVKDNKKVDTGIVVS